MNRYRAGQPAELPIDYADDEPDDESDESMGMLAYMIVALVLVCAAMGIGFIVGRYVS